MSSLRLHRLRERKRCACLSSPRLHSFRTWIKLKSISFLTSRARATTTSTRSDRMIPSAISLFRISSLFLMQSTNQSFLSSAAAHRLLCNFISSSLLLLTLIDLKRLSGARSLWRKTIARTNKISIHFTSSFATTTTSEHRAESTLRFTQKDETLHPA